MVATQQGLGVSMDEEGDGDVGAVTVKANKWADLDSGDDEEDEWQKMPVSVCSRRRAELGADGWILGADGFWTKRFDKVNRIPKCMVDGMVRVLARDRESGSVIYDADRTARPQAPSMVFKKPRSIDVIAEVNLAEGWFPAVFRRCIFIRKVDIYVRFGWIIEICLCAHLNI